MQFNFRQSYDVRYDECNVFGYVTPAALLRYLQDIAGLDAARVQLITNGTWVARRTVIEFGSQSVPARAKLEIETYPMGFSKVTAHRAYDLRLLPAGTFTANTVSDEPIDRPTPLIQARTLWVFLDEQGHPARIPASFYNFWQVNGPRPQPRPEAEWPPFPERTPRQCLAQVGFSDLDVMGHMNNAAYVEHLDDAAWQAFQQIGLRPDQSPGYLKPLHYDIEYSQSAIAGDDLTIDSWFSPLPDPANSFERLDRILCHDKLIVRARSRWQWQTDSGKGLDLSRLWV